MAQGEAGRAFVTYERAFELADVVEDPARGAEMRCEARWRMACALKVLGKLYMTEHELRELLKERDGLRGRGRLRCLLQLGYLYRELSDAYLASVLLGECLGLARELQDSETEAGVLNSLGNILHDEGRPGEAIERYRQSLAILERQAGCLEMQATLRTNLGGALVEAGHFQEGVEELHQAQALARRGGFRRAAALALTRLGEAWRQRHDAREALRHLAESDALASRPEGSFYDILFLNAYHRWRMAREDDHKTGERIAFGRLRHLRSMLQRRFPEVVEFDRQVERMRR